MLHLSHQPHTKDRLVYIGSFGEIAYNLACVCLMLSWTKFNIDLYDTQCFTNPKIGKLQKLFVKWGEKGILPIKIIIV